jgi:pimeloyl-ACP methyl ester carboxylesterase
VDDRGSTDSAVVENFQSRLEAVNSIDLAKSASEKAIRHSIDIDAGQVVYFEYPSKDPGALTLVMIHGYRGNHRGLEAIAAGLSNFRVLIPDLPGFGESKPLASTHSVENYSLWLAKFVARLGLTENLHLMGHSFGTLIVGQYATKNTLQSVSLVNPISKPALAGPRSALTKLTGVYYALAAVVPDALGQWLLRHRSAVMLMSVVMAKSKDKSLRRWIHTQHLNNFSDFASVRVATEGYEASVSTDLSQLAPAIDSPVLVVAAELDDITDIDSQRTVAKTYPSAVLMEIEQVGHLVHYEAPDQAAKMIEDFLKRLK